MSLIELPDGVILVASSVVAIKPCKRESDYTYYAIDTLSGHTYIVNDDKLARAEFIKKLSS